MRYFLGVLLVLADVLVLARPAEACSCLSRTIAAAAATADSVFVGEIIDLKEEPKGKYVDWRDATRFTVKFRVSGFWRGRVGKEIELATTRPAIGDSCIDLFEVKFGQTYVVYAKDGRFTTICSQTKEASKAAEDIRRLGKPKIPK
jgi:hypothetical protein